MPDPAIDPLSSAVETASRLFEANFAAGDVAALVEHYYSSEPVVVGEGVGTFTGRDGAATYFKGAIADFKACTLVSRSLEAAGDYAFETGEVRLIPRGTAASPVTLSYLVGWLRTTDQGWRVRLDYFVPAALEPTASGNERSI